MLLITCSLLLIGGCAKNSVTVPPGNQMKSEGSAPNESSESSSPGQGSSSPGNSESGSGSDSGGVSHGGTSIIVKSDNAITDADKLEVLGELETEIDALVTSLNNLEDAPDTELTYE